VEVFSVFLKKEQKTACLQKKQNNGFKKTGRLDLTKNRFLQA